MCRGSGDLLFKPGGDGLPIFTLLCFPSMLLLIAVCLLVQVNMEARQDIEESLVALHAQLQVLDDQ